MNAAFDALPAADAACRASIAIPARNEAEEIAATLEALVAQRSRTGAALAPELFEVVVYANGCTDATAAEVRAFAALVPAHRIYVAVDDPPPDRAHIGFARRAVMDACGERMRARDGAVLTTDADTRVHRTWLAETLAVLADVDAVVGRILLPTAVLAAESPAVRALLTAENAYQFTVAHAEALLDPLPHDPWPRHWQQFGASFALHAAVYARVGGVPEVERLEDVALYTALLRMDARVRHALTVRVHTSARPEPRVAGGFGTHLADMRRLAETDEPFVVESPLATFRRIQARGRARRLFRADDDGRVSEVAEMFGSSYGAVAARRKLATTAGAFVHELEIEADGRSFFGPANGVPVSEAYRTLRRYLSRARDATAVPTRASAASGAG